MRFIFYLSIIWIIYTYIGYPLLLAVFSFFKRNKVSKDDSFTPSVSLIIAAYNEEKVIRRKIEQSLMLDYPQEKLRIVIASDASTDKTDEIVREFSGQGVVLVRQEERRGKTAVQNLALKKVKGAVLVFSDATTIFEKDAIRKLVRHFKETNVGSVAGREKFLNSDNEISKEANFFWNYELFLRKKEGQLNSLIGVSGCIFAIRKELYAPLAEGLIEDLVLPLQVVSKGYRVRYEEEAVGYEKAAGDTGSEFIRKARIVAGGINALYTMRHLLNPFRYPVLSFQLISHKLFRWLAPLFMILLLVSNIFLLFENSLFLTLGILQIGFYGLALLGYFLQIRKRLPGVLRLIYHFCIINFSAILGIVKFLKGERRVIWQPAR